MAIRFLLGNMFKIGTLQGERIAAPVCATSRNDREIGAWFLKLMTLPPHGGGAPRSELKKSMIAGGNHTLISSAPGRSLGRMRGCRANLFQRRETGA